MIGTKIGMVNSAMPTQSRNIPSTKRISIMNRMMIVGFSEMPVISAETNLMPPIRLNTPTRALAPMPIHTIMPQVARVCRTAPLSIGRLNSRRTMVESSTPSTPTAEASVTEAMPP